jgi:hypothetical protein
MLDYDALVKLGNEIRRDINTISTGDVIFRCQQCGNYFSRKKGDVICNGGGIYCGTKCQLKSVGIHDESTIDKIMKGEKIHAKNHCIVCGTSCNKKYCKSCKSKSIETREKMRLSHIGKKHSEETCKKIGKSNKGKNTGKKRSILTRLKMSILKTGDKHPNWKGGVSRFPYCEKWTPELRERVRIKYGQLFGMRKCFECGKLEIDNGRLLDVHHVYYNKEMCCDDSERLLIPLCKSCHSKTQHNRKYWINHFIELLNNTTGFDGTCWISKEEYMLISSPVISGSSRADLIEKAPIQI